MELLHGHPNIIALKCSFEDPQVRVGVLVWGWGEGGERGQGGMEEEMGMGGKEGEVGWRCLYALMGRYEGYKSARVGAYVCEMMPAAQSSKHHWVGCLLDDPQVLVCTGIGEEGWVGLCLCA